MTNIDGTDDVVAHQQITDVIYRYCRGMDRMDRDLTLSCWHPGGTDDHAPLYAGSAEGFVEWLWPVHAKMVATRHVISNIQIALNGDKAATESYWNVQLRVERAGEAYDINGAGRYIDQFERVDGVWAIRHRISLSDMNHVTKITEDLGSYNPPLIMPNNPDVPAQRSARDKSDHSYTVFDTLLDG